MSFVGALKVTVEAPKVPTDTSSLEVSNGASATFDGDKWCDTTGITLGDVTQQVPCDATSQGYVCLAALEVTKDGLTWLPSAPPKLKYDLDAHSAKKDACYEGVEDCYAIYQWYLPGKASIQGWCPAPPSGATAVWCYVGPAKKVSAGVKTYAEGNLSHFSTYGLFVLPAAKPLPTPSAFIVTVMSRFYRTGKNEVWVSLRVDRVSQGNLGSINDRKQHLFRFRVVEFPGNLVACPPGRPLLYGSNDPVDRLSCTLPVGTQVEISAQSGSLTMTSTTSVPAPKRVVLQVAEQSMY